MPHSRALRVTHRCYQSNGEVVLVKSAQVGSCRRDGCLLADPETFSATNAEIFVAGGFAVFNPDGQCGAYLQTTRTAIACGLVIANIA